MPPVTAEGAPFNRTLIGVGRSGNFSVPLGELCQAEIEDLLTMTSVHHRAQRLRMYDWGPWVNGGAWIQTSVGKVYSVYRNLDQVQMVIEDGRQGVWRDDHDQQPPYGFRSVVCFGEHRSVFHSMTEKPDCPGELVGRRVQPADVPQLRRFGRCLQCRRQHGSRRALSRARAFRMNEAYFVSDKYATRLVEQFALRPREFIPRLERVFSSPKSRVQYLLE